MNARRNSPYGLMAAVDHIAVEARRQGLDVIDAHLHTLVLDGDAVLLTALWPSGEVISGYAHRGMDDLRAVMEETLQ